MNINTISDLRAAWEGIRNDTRRGASELLRQALESLADFMTQPRPAEREIDFESLCGELAGLRQDMVGFANSARLLDRTGAGRMLKSLNDLREYLDKVPDRIAEAAAGALDGSEMTIMTNSRSSATEKTLLALAESGRLKQVLQMESRPACEGRDNTEKLLASGISVTVLPDGAIGCWLEAADGVIVGSDAVGENGDFLGKIGCFPLACLARRRNIPYYVAAEKLKITPELLTLETVNQRFTGEPLAWGNHSERLSLSHIIFERTPGDLVTGFLTESGLIYPPLSRMFLS